MIRPLNDWVLIAIEPSDPMTLGGLFKVSEDFMRAGKVLKVGPGRHYIDKYVPTVIEEGSRVCFMAGVKDTLQGQQLEDYMPEGHCMIRESDILLVLEEDTVVTLAGW